MASIQIYVTGYGPAESGDDLVWTGQARCSGMTSADDTISWSATVDPGALAATVNQAFKDAAVAAAGDAGFTVGLGDKKTLIGAAVGL